LKSWHDINWLEVELAVKQLRNQIFIASRKGDLNRVGNLQKVMMRSNANRLMAVRRVTQINKGRRTPGIDQKVYETPAERLQLAQELVTIRVNDWQPLPVKRIYIPKKPAKMRPLGIPTQLDRCFQAIVKNALEPYWEAQFEHFSFGFRPGRRATDAITAIFKFTLKGARLIILDADIKGAFDNMSHDPIMDNIGNSPTRFIVRKWLEAGIMEGVEFSPTPQGTPQGGIVSPLLANIALHGMEAAIGMERSNHQGWQCPTVLVRYADDFVAMSWTVEDNRIAEAKLQDWLSPRGLEMSAEKTTTRHLDEGFDFLGFHIRRYPAKATKRSGFRVMVTPAKENVSRIKDDLREIYKRRRTHKTDNLIAEINPKIRGWCLYYRHCSSWNTFAKLTTFLWHRNWRWALRRHSNKGTNWTKVKYFNSNWRLVGEDKVMLKFTDFKYIRLPSLLTGASPDNPDEEEYWEKRRSIPSVGLKAKAKLWRRQKGLCEFCKGELDNGEEIVQHHLDPERPRYILDNQVLIHETCHQKAHHQRTA